MTVVVCRTFRSCARCKCIEHCPLSPLIEFPINHKFPVFMTVYKKICLCRFWNLGFLHIFFIFLSLCNIRYIQLYQTGYFSLKNKVRNLNKIFVLGDIRLITYTICTWGINWKWSWFPMLRIPPPSLQAVEIERPRSSLPMGHALLCGTVDRSAYLAPQHTALPPLRLVYVFPV